MKHKTIALLLTPYTKAPEDRFIICFTSIIWIAFIWHGIILLQADAQCDFLFHLLNYTIIHNNYLRVYCFDCKHAVLEFVTYGAQWYYMYIHIGHMLEYVN